MNYTTLLDSIEQHIRDRIDEVGAIPYFVTVTFSTAFDSWRSPIVRSTHSTFRSFEYCYGCLMNSKLLLGNNYNRKLHLQPLTYAFVDFPHTKRRRTTDGRGQFEQMRLAHGHPERNPHIHAVMAVHPRTQKNLKTLGSDGLRIFFKRFCSDVMTVDLQRVNSLRDPVAVDRITKRVRIVTPDRPHDPGRERLDGNGVIPYASKALRYEHDESRQRELYAVLPDSQFRIPDRVERSFLAEDHRRPAPTPPVERPMAATAFCHGAWHEFHEDGSGRCRSGLAPFLIRSGTASARASTCETIPALTPTAAAICARGSAKS